MPTDWERVAETVKRRRVERGLSQRAAAQAAGLSPTTWGSLELHHQRLEPLSRPKIARALGWTPDSLDRILAGGEPEDDGSGPPRSTEERLNAVEADVAEIRQILDRVVQGIEARAASTPPPPARAPRS